MKRLIILGAILMMACVMSVKATDSGMTGCGTFNPVQVISGTVYFELNPPKIDHASWATVQLLASDSYQVCQSVTATKDGYFAFSPVHVPNNYVIRIRDPYNNNILGEVFIYAYAYMEPLVIDLSEL